MKKRILCLFMSFALLFCAVVPAFAADIEMPDTRYRVTVVADGHGTITVTPATPYDGEEVYVVAQPNLGYELGSISVTDTAGKSVQTTNTEFGVMYRSPAGDTTVTVTFKDAPSVFSDVAVNAWYYSDVIFLYQNNIMKGTSDTTFSPNGVVNRAQIVTILHRMKGEPVETGMNEFSDVMSGTYYTSAVVWASRHGLVQGYGNGKFGPDDPVTREQIAVFLYRYVQMLGHDVRSNSTLLNSFKDGSTVSQFAVEAMGWAVNVGLMKGSDNNLLPHNGATRAEVSALIHRFCTLYGAN